MKRPAASSWNPSSPALKGPESDSRAALINRLARIAWAEWKRELGRSRGNLKGPEPGFRVLRSLGLSPSFGDP